MPKIRLSALATDIKGKAGGSVFSNNSGGTYFRNNPSGGGRKTEKWAKSKAALSHISTLWRNLTDQERAAWNASKTNFPTVNAFGEPRTPSGYEVFMKLNTTLVNLGIQFQTLPPSPRILPNYGDSEIITPDLFLFTPFAGYANYAQNIGKTCAVHNDCAPGEQCIAGFCVAPDDNPITLSRLTLNSKWSQFNFSAILNFDLSKSFLDPNVPQLPILFAENGPTELINIAIFDLNSPFPTLVCNFKSGITEIDITFLFPTQLDSKDFRMYVQLDFFDPINSMLFVDNVAIPANAAQGSGFLLNLDGLKLSLAKNNTDNRTALVMQDIRFYDTRLTEDETDLLFRGYKLNTETIHYDTTFTGLAASLECSIDSDCPPDMECLAGDCYAIEPGGFFSTDLVNYGTIQQNSTLTLFIAYGINQMNVAIKRLFSPSIRLDTTNAGLNDSRLIVNASAPSSNGINGSYGLFKRIAVIDANNISDFEFGEEYISTYDFIPFDSAIFFEFNTILTDTGQATPKADDKKKTPRFKAGADISKHVA